MAQLQFAAQKIHHDFIVTPVVEEIGSAQTADELETDALIDALRRLVVRVHLDLDAVKIAEEEAVLANEAGRFGAVALPSRRGLADPDEQRTGLRAGEFPSSR
jgi:hypothetical protein